MDSHLTNESSKYLSELIRIGVVDPVLSPCDARTITPGFFRWFRTLRERPGHAWDKETMQLWPSSQSTRWQEHRFTTAAHDTVTDYWAIELARFAVPQGQIGYIKYIEQVVNDVDGSYWPTNVAYWGSPRFVISDVENLRWYLNISRFPGFFPPRYELFSAVPIPAHALPGSPYPDLPEIDAIWYPAHAGKDMKLIVPGAHMLRFYLISPPTTVYQWEVSGKLSGFTQSSYQPCAKSNSREIV